MFTDLVGFTQLSQRDEEGALRLRHEHQTLVRAPIAAHGGREVKTLGDGFLIEFPSAVESVRTAVEIQEAVSRRNSAPGVTERMQLRIGIHVGDVIEDGTDIVGDAVNVASRIEPLADPGGICLSETVFAQVRNKLRVPLEGIGLRHLKNVEHPMEIYRVVLSGEARSGVGTETEDGARLRFAVLPFVNRSPEAKDDYLADGLTDELISHVSKLPNVRVIARTSVLRYKGTERSVREIGAELGVRLVLEGSVRKSADRIRISAQLVDARSEETLWSTRYDRPLADVFAIQDEIAEEIAREVAGELSRSGVATLVPYVRAPPDTPDLEAYSEFLHGRKLSVERASEASMREALTHFETATRRDPAFARAHVGVADTLVWLAVEGATPYEESIARARTEVATALRLNEHLAEAHAVLAGMLLSDDRVPDAEREARRAVELNPSLAEPYRWLAQLAAGDGRPDEMVALLEAAQRLDPVNINILAFLGRAYWYAGREVDARAHWDRTLPLVAFRTNVHRTEFYLARRDLANAAATVRELERLRPSSIWTITFRGMLAAFDGREDDARRELADLDRRTAVGDPTDFQAGFVHYALGERDAFFDSLERAFARHNFPALEMMYSPLFSDVRSDPRMVDLFRRQAGFRRGSA